MRTDCENDRENAPHETSQRAEMEQAHTISAQVIGSNPEPLEFALLPIRPHIAIRELFRIPGLVFAVVIQARPLVLARCARFVSGLETRRFSAAGCRRSLRRACACIKAHDRLRKVDWEKTRTLEGGSESSMVHFLLPARRRSQLLLCFLRPDTTSDRGPAAQAHSTSRSCPFAPSSRRIRIAFFILRTSSARASFVCSPPRTSSAAHMRTTCSSSSATSVTETSCAAGCRSRGFEGLAREAPSRRRERYSDTLFRRRWTLSRYWVLCGRESVCSARGRRGHFRLGSSSPLEG